MFKNTLMNLSVCCLEEPHRTIKSSESADILLFSNILVTLIFEQVRIGSEMLYDILTDGSLGKSKGLAIVCSKSDISGKAVKPDKVQAVITKELDRLRSTRGILGMYTRAQFKHAMQSYTSCLTHLLAAYIVADVLTTFNHGIFEYCVCVCFCRCCNHRSDSDSFFVYPVQCYNMQVLLVITVLRIKGVVSI
jgi:hypothetical protein